VKKFFFGRNFLSRFFLIIGNRDRTCALCGDDDVVDVSAERLGVVELWRVDNALDHANREQRSVVANVDGLRLGQLQRRERARRRRRRRRRPR
jgi:hypothetical protein